MTPIHSIVARGVGFGLLALVSAGCAAGSGASDGLRSPQGNQQCLLVSQDLLPIDPEALVEAHAVEGWLEEWATRAKDDDLGEFHAVWSLNTTAPEPDEDEEESAPQATGEEDAAPPRSGPPDAFLIESSLTLSQATALTEVVRRARILDDAEPGLPSRARLEAMRDSSGRLHLTPMMSTHCRPALADPRRGTTELIRAARGARATGSTVTTRLSQLPGRRSPRATP